LTILVGVLCRDGVVIGTDSSATFQVGNIKTIEQPITKIEIIDRRIIVAGTGSVGLQQRFISVITKLANNKQLNSDKVDEISMAKLLSTEMIKDMDSTYIRRGLFGALVAYPVGKKYFLCEFDLDYFQPELKTLSGIWFVSMGSGHIIVDPFLGFIRRVFWPADKYPTCQEGIFATVWAVQQAIDLNTGGIKGPIKVATLTLNTKGEPEARFLDDTDLEEHKAYVKGAESHLRTYTDFKREAPTKPIPEPKA
jgi:20S proteasome alpha/beta subunit